MVTINVQFTAKFDCELYLEPRETIEEAIVRGGFQHFSPELLLYRTFELDDDGDMVTFMFVDTVGWIIIGTAGVAAPPVVTL